MFKREPTREMAAMGRRYRTLWITPELMMDSLFSPIEHDGFMKWTTQEGMPADCYIIAVCYSDERHAFGLRLFHESFSEVPIGEIVPDIKPLFTAHTVNVDDVRRFDFREDKPIIRHANTFPLEGD